MRHPVTLENATVGMRVELNPGYDLWMRGAKYGTLRQVYRRPSGKIVAQVKMDHPDVKTLIYPELADLTTDAEPCPGTP